MPEEPRPLTGGRRASRPWVRHAAVLAFFAVMAAVHTWPLASAPGTLSRHDNGDALLNEWTVAWVQHQLPRDPLHLFDANIFYPERNTLAFSEHLFVQSMLGLPLHWAGQPGQRACIPSGHISSAMASSVRCPCTLDKIK